MNPSPAPGYTAFIGHRLLARGRLADVAVAVHAAARADAASVLVFDDRNGQQIDLHLGGDALAVAERYRQAPGEAEDRTADEPQQAQAPRGRGRPRLGVTAREVTLLPRHWDWLAEQPGGASVTLRKLIDQARRHGESGTRQRLAREAAYRCLNALAGDAPGAEDATRALFAGDRQAFLQRLQAWPADVREYLLTLAADAFAD